MKSDRVELHYRVLFHFPNVLIVGADVVRTIAMVSIVKGLAPYFICDEFATIRWKEIWLLLSEAISKVGLHGLEGSTGGLFAKPCVLLS